MYEIAAVVPNAISGSRLRLESWNRDALKKRDTAVPSVKQNVDTTTLREKHVDACIYDATLQMSEEIAQGSELSQDCVRGYSGRLLGATSNR